MSGRIKIEFTPPMLLKEIRAEDWFLQTITTKIIAIRHPRKRDLNWWDRKGYQSKSQEHESDLLTTIRLQLM